MGSVPSSYSQYCSVGQRHRMGGNCGSDDQCRQYDEFPDIESVHKRECGHGHLCDNSRISGGGRDCDGTLHNAGADINRYHDGNSGNCCL